MGESSKPIVVVAIENHRGIGSDSALAQEPLQVFLADKVAPDRIIQIGLPAPIHCAGDVTRLIGGGIHVYLYEPYIRVVAVLGYPVCRNEDI